MLSPGVGDPQVGFRVGRPGGEHMRSVLIAGVLGLSLMVASCCKSQPDESSSAPPPATTTATTATPTAAATVDSPLKVGAAVMAPWSRTGKRYGGHVTELYGKLAHVNFNDGDRGWALIEQCRPKGIPSPEPSDTCAFSVGDKVKAPWSRNKAMYSGSVAETHGKLALINFLDGDKGWALCSEMRAR
jgi:hypothetical protein